MNSAIWTVILHSQGSYKSVIELGSRDHKQAKKDIETRHPGCSVVAIVPGSHSSVYTFSLTPHSGQLTNDIFHDNGNQPTGGSD